MAITITKDTDNNYNGESWEKSDIPATQGNVVETLAAYNEELQYQYYDKGQVDSDTNALQTSIQNIVKKLVSNTNFKDKKKTTNTNITKSDELESVTNFDEDSSKGFSESGLIQKINIIANLLSGTTTSSNQNWDSTTIGNNVGGIASTTTGESATTKVNCFNPYRPVIGMTRAKGDGYTASILDGHTVTINGLSSIKNESDSTKTQDISGSVVLSEKQVANMIETAVTTVLGTYDTQIGSILGYLLFTTDSLPDSFLYALRNTKDENLKNLPLYVKEYDANNSCYVFQDLNGALSYNGKVVGEAIKFTEDNVDKGLDIKDSNSDTAYWHIALDSDGSNGPYYNHFVVTKVGDANKTKLFTIPIPQYSIDIDIGKADTVTTVVKSICMFNDNNTTAVLSEGNNARYTEDGKATIEVPLGSRPTINLPNGVVTLNNDAFEIKSSNDTTTANLKANSNTSDYYIHRNLSLHCGYYTVTVNPNNKTDNKSLTGSTYEGNSTTVDVSGVSYLNYTLSNTTEKGYTVVTTNTTTSDSTTGSSDTETSKTITYSNLKENISDGLVWTANKVSITYDTNDGTSSGNLGTTTATYDAEYTIDADDPTKDGYEFAGWEVDDTSASS